ncbi:MAG: IS1182 family transposase, partial [Desulforhopalus sp.]
QLDISSITNEYGGRGSKAYDPAMMTALLFYGYATGVFSSRKIERSTYDSVAFRYIAGNTHPDHDTIATFRRRFLPHLKGIFVQILQIAHEMNILRLGAVSLDGTKLKANASKHKALSYGHASKLEKQLEQEINDLLQKAEQTDSVDLPDGMSIPEEISRRENRLEAIRKAKAEIESRAAERNVEENKAYKEKMAKREAKEKKTGKKTPGKPPQPPTAGPASKDQVNLTDDESRIMPVSGGGFDQCYNAQAGVDTASQLVVCSYVSQKPNDKKEVQPAIKELQNLNPELGEVSALLADNGYFSCDNCAIIEHAGITPYVAVGREKHNTRLEDRFSDPPSLPEGADYKSTMQHRLKTKVGKALYAARKSTVEPVFGIIKHVLGFRQFSLRGLEGVQGEWDLVSIAWNLKRMHVLA